MCGSLLSELNQHFDLCACVCHFSVNQRVDMCSYVCFSYFSVSVCKCVCLCVCLCSSPSCSGVLGKPGPEARSGVLLSSFSVRLGPLVLLPKVLSILVLAPIEAVLFSRVLHLLLVQLLLNLTLFASVGLSGFAPGVGASRQV